MKRGHRSPASTVTDAGSTPASTGTDAARSGGDQGRRGRRPGPGPPRPWTGRRGGWARCRGRRPRRAQRQGLGRAACPGRPGPGAGRAARPLRRSGAGSPSSAAEHSIPLDHSPRILRRPISMPSGHDGAHGGQGDQVADRHVEGAAHDLQQARRRRRRRRRAGSCRRRDGGGWPSTRATTMPSRPPPTRSTPSTTRPRLDRADGQLGHVGVESARSRGARRGVRASDDPQNWVRNRRSLSSRIRMSASPWRTWARRSMPKPKAKPV